MVATKETMTLFILGSFIHESEGIKKPLSCQLRCPRTLLNRDKYANLERIKVGLRDGSVSTVLSCKREDLNHNSEHSKSWVWQCTCNSSRKEGRRMAGTLLTSQYS